jgi:hypothetical protein
LFNVAGTGQTTPISINGNSIANSTYDPTKLQFIYGGSGNVFIGGGSTTACLVYAPNADVTITGNGDIYGAVVGGRVNIPGSANLHYDRNLENSAITAGNPVMSSFTWRSF